VEPEEYLQEERFDKIKYYLKTNQYPAGADRAEKSRLRSASAHYRLIPASEAEHEKLMLKDKEVISDPTRQYEIAFKTHTEHHGGINKTTATIAEKYHWVRIKETVSAAIRNCSDCKEAAARPPKSEKPVKESSSTQASGQVISPSQPKQEANLGAPLESLTSGHIQTPSVSMGELNPNIHPDPQEQHPVPLADMGTYDYHMQMPVDPQIMDGIRQHAEGDYEENPTQHQLHQYATQGHYDLHDYSAHNEYAMHQVQPGDDAHGQYGGHGMDDAQLQEQLRQDMGQQYQHQGS